MRDADDDPEARPIQGDRKPTGAARASLAAVMKSAMREREQVRVGMPEKIAALAVRVGPAPLDPVLNPAWIGNVCIGLAEIALHDPTMPLEEKIGHIRNLAKATGDVKDSAALAERIRLLEESRGMAKKELPDGLDTLPPRRPSPQA